MMTEPLTDGAIARMNDGATPEVLQPVLQVIDMKLVSTSPNAVERYRLVLSDGTHLQQAMLATQKNHMVLQGKVKKGTVVRLTQYSVNTIQNRVIIIVCDMIVVTETVDNIIGNPKPFPAGTLPTPRMDSGYNGSYSSNADTGRYPSANRSGLYAETVVLGFDLGVKKMLTEGAITRMNDGATPELLQPVLQVIDMKLVSTGQSAVERYSMVLSDGTHLQRAMLATQKNDLVLLGKVKKGTVVRLTQYSVNTIQCRVIIILCDMIVVTEMVDNIIGNPKPFPTSSGRTSAPRTQNMAAGTLPTPRMDSGYNDLLAHLPALFDLFRESIGSGSFDMRRSALSLIYCIATFPDGKKHLRQRGAVKYLVKLMDGGNHWLLDDILRALFQLQFDERSSEMVINGILNALFNYLDDEDLVRKLPPLLTDIKNDRVVWEHVIESDKLYNKLFDILKDYKHHSVAANGFCVEFLSAIIKSNYCAFLATRKCEEECKIITRLVKWGNPQAKEIAEKILTYLGAPEDPVVAYRTGGRVVIV